MYDDEMEADRIEREEVFHQIDIGILEGKLTREQGDKMTLVEAREWVEKWMPRKEAGK